MSDEPGDAQEDGNNSDANDMSELGWFDLLGLEDTSDDGGN
jgi:hypothetical protein